MSLSIDGVEEEQALLRLRTIPFMVVVTDEAADCAIEHLRRMAREKPDERITLLVHSPGGAVSAGLRIARAVDEIGTPVATVCVGQAQSMAAILVAHGTSGLRRCLPTGWLSFTPVEAFGEKPAPQTELEACERDILNLLADDTGQSVAQLKTDMAERRVFNAQEAKAYGLVDEVGTISAPWPPVVRRAAGPGARRLEDRR